MVEVGEATTLDPVVGLTEAVGAHEYVLAPLLVSVEVCPTQIAVGDADAVTVGNGFTVTVTVAVFTHPAAEVPVTVYVVVTVGDAVTEEPVDGLTLVLGAHEYVLAPLAVRVEV